MLLFTNLRPISNKIAFCAVLAILLPAAASNAQTGAGGKDFEFKVSNYTGFYGSTLRTDDVAYVGTHTHSFSLRNKSYIFSYMYLVSIPVGGASEVILPDNHDMIVFSATAER